MDILSKSYRIGSMVYLPTFGIDLRMVNDGRYSIHGYSQNAWFVCKRYVFSNHGGFRMPALKLTFSHLKMDGWNMSFLLGWRILRCHEIPPKPSH